MDCNCSCPPAALLFVVLVIFLFNFQSDFWFGVLVGTTVLVLAHYVWMEWRKRRAKRSAQEKGLESREGDGPGLGSV